MVIYFINAESPPLRGLSPDYHQWLIDSKVGNSLLLNADGTLKFHQNIRRIPIG